MPDVLGRSLAAHRVVDVVASPRLLVIDRNVRSRRRVASSDEHPPATTSAAINHARDIADTVGVSVTLVPATCESCGAVEDQLYPVHRRYVTPAEWDTPARDVTLQHVEQWCFSCCTHYPHEPAG